MLRRLNPGSPKHARDAARHGSRPSRLSAAAVSIGLAAAGLGLASGTAQARPSADSPVCKIGMLCLYDLPRYDTRGEYRHEPVDIRPRVRWDQPVNLGTFRGGGTLQDRVSSWINNSKTTLCAYEVETVQFKSEVVLLWKMHPRQSGRSRVPFVPEVVDKRIDFIKTC